MLSSPLQNVVSQAGSVILGKEHQIRLAVTCLLARGHLLIEDLPGVGKTTLSHVLARLLGLKFQRIDTELRERRRAEWNRPLLWPLFLVAVLIAFGTVPAFIGYRRRERAAAKRISE